MTTTEAETFSFPEHVSASDIDQILDIAASAYVATEDGDHGVIVEDSQNWSLVALALIASLHDGDSIRRTIIICDVEATLFWEQQIEKLTNFTQLCYVGSRRKGLLRERDPQILVTTHETLRPELLVRKPSPGKRSSGAWEIGPMYEELTDRPTLWVFDGLRKVCDRRSENYHAYSSLLDDVAGDRILGLAHEPLSVDESLYNLGRLFAPSRMPSVAQFETDYCRGRNLIFRQEKTKSLVNLFGPTLLRPPTNKGFMDD